MGETAGWDPGDWAGHDFGHTARAAYDDIGKRSYATAKATKKTSRDLLPEKLVSLAPIPHILIVDQTGSMGPRTKILYDKSAYYDSKNELYLGKNRDTCVGAIGDANSDDPVEDYPLQFRNPARGPELRKRIEELVLEGQGGGQTKETYELAMLYLDRNFEFPNAVQKPIVIFNGDEGFYETISPAVARKHAYVSLEKAITTKEVYKSLSKKCSLWMIRFRYDSNEEKNDIIQKQWEDLFTEDRVIFTEEPDRIVDIAFGILAYETGKIKDFIEDMHTRQTPAQVKTVFGSLARLLGSGNRTPRLLETGTKHHADSGPRTKRLLGDGS